MTEAKSGVGQPIRLLAVEELRAVAGGADLHAAAMRLWVSPLAIHGFNPQPDPPAMPLVLPPNPCR